jgi:hypothetical protein
VISADTSKLWATGKRLRSCHGDVKSSSQSCCGGPRGRLFTGVVCLVRTLKVNNWGVFVEYS